jgi:hypothetical protein
MTSTSTKNRQLRAKSDLRGAFDFDTPQLVSDYAEEINRAWRKAADNSLDHILDVCAICAEAKRLLPRPQKQELLDSLCLNRSQFVRMARIGGDPRLKDQKIRRLLPSSRSILYDLAALDDVEFEEAFRSEKIHPAMSRAELANWRKSIPGNAIRRAEETFKGKQARWLHKVSERMRRDARAIVREERRRALAGRPRGTRWLSWDEVLIDHVADHDRIREVLEIVGRPDEFERIRDRAFYETPEPEVPEILNRAETAEEQEEAWAELRRQIEQKGRSGRTNFKDFV